MAGLCIALLCTPSLKAQVLPLRTVDVGEIGLQVSDYSYEADRGGTFAMSLLGKKLGLVAGFTQALGNTWFWGGEIRALTGATAFSSATTGRRSGDTETLTELKLTAGSDFELGRHVIAPYAGLGYRTVFSLLKGYTSTGNAMPSRNAEQAYLPLGLTHRMHSGPAARIATTLEYDYLLGGTQRTQYTDISGYTQDLSNSQRQGHGARLRIAYETRHWSAGLFFHYWNVEESQEGTYAKGTTVYTSTEPHNISRETGVEIRYRFN